MNLVSIWSGINLKLPIWKTPLTRFFRDKETNYFLRVDDVIRKLESYSKLLDAQSDIRFLKFSTDVIRASYNAKQSENVVAALICNAIVKYNQDVEDGLLFLISVR